MPSTQRERADRVPRRGGAALLLLLLLVLVSIAAICQVWTRLRAIEYGYRLSAASQAQARLLETNRRLRVELGLLTSPGRVARIASEELGLQPPAPEQVRRLRRRPAPAPVEVAASIESVSAQGSAPGLEETRRSGLSRSQHTMLLARGGARARAGAGVAAPRPEHEGGPAAPGERRPQKAQEGQ